MSKKGIVNASRIKRIMKFMAGNIGSEISVKKMSDMLKDDGIVIQPYLLDDYIDALDRDGLLEAVYVSPSVKDVPTLKEQWECDELLIKLHDHNDISTRPIDWSVCNDELGHRFAYVPYYIIVIKGGIIPPQYIKKEN